MKNYLVLCDNLLMGSQLWLGTTAWSKKEARRRVFNDIRTRRFKYFIVLDEVKEDKVQ